MSTQPLLRRFPFLSRIALWVILPFIIILLGGYGYFSKTSAVAQGELKLPGLSATVTLTRDQHSVPYITAKNDFDAYFSLGFVHAQDRLWQMEMNRRLGAGRLSEVLGEQTLGTDLFVRTLGLYRNAQKMLADINPNDKKILLHYVDGVNAGIQQLNVLPPEFLMAGFEPETWLPEDSLVWMQLMTMNLSGNSQDEIQRALLIKTLGLKKTNQLMPAVSLDTADVPTISMSDTTFGLPGTKEGQLTGVMDLLRRGKYVGSNSWVVSGRHTASGTPILANDPHLRNSMPSIWYLAAIKGDRLDSIGATFPGLPFVVIGKNRDISWGMTNLMADTQDIYLEKINPLNRNQYEVDGEYKDMTIYHERVKVKPSFLAKPKPPVTIAIRRTRQGPVISDIGSQLDNFAYSMRWTGDDQTAKSFSSFIKLNYASNWQQFNAALADFEAPAHNFIYADHQGNIGSVSPGYFPLRHKGQGSIPASGWDSGYDWQGWIPFNEVPRQFNPDSGFIVTANNNITDKDYRHHITSDWGNDYRANLISSELKRLIKDTKGKITSEDMQRLQGNIQTPTTNTLLAKFKTLTPNTQRQQEALALLTNWDGLMAMDSPAASLYAAWTGYLNKLLLEDDLNGMQFTPAEQASLHTLLSEPHQKFLETVYIAEQSEFCDYAQTQTKESCQQILYFALDHAIDDLSKKLGSDAEDWAWRKLHKTQYPHYPLSDSHLAEGHPPSDESIFSDFFHRQIANHGDGDTINVAPVSFKRDARYLQFYGPSYRQVVTFGADNPSYFIQNTGQSGNVFSQHYDDLINQFRDQQYLPMTIDKAITTQVLLSPVAPGQSAQHKL